jgi:hypothetical protein
MKQPTPRQLSPRRAALLLAAVFVLAMLCRLPCLRAELWFDEVWSWEFARTAATPWQIFFGPDHHHDNNHKLNTLYLYFVPDGLPFPCYRLHSFVAGLAAVLLAFRAAARRSAAAGLLAALFVAVNYWLVLCSAEARGYALAVAFALAAFDGLQRYLRDGGRWHLAQFWAGVILGFLAHLTFLHAYLALGVWTVYHCARNRATKGNELLQLARIHAIPAGFVALLFVVDVRGMQIGGAPTTSITDVLGRLLCFDLGMPFTPVFAVVAAVLAAAVLVRGVEMLRGEGDDSWVFFATAIVGAPLMLLLARPAFVYERYLFLPSLFFLVLLGYVLADLARYVSFGTVAAVVAVLGITAGNLLEIESFVAGGGRGRFLEALRHIDAESGEGDVTVAGYSGDHDLRAPKMFAFYGPYVNPRRRFVYVRIGELAAHPADWYLVQRPDRDEPPAPEFELPEYGSPRYREDRGFTVTAFGGWDWYVYRRVVPP